MSNAHATRTLTATQEVTLCAITAELCRDMVRLAKASSYRKGAQMADTCRLAMGQLVVANNRAECNKILADVAYECRLTDVWVRYCEYLLARDAIG